MSVMEWIVVEDLERKYFEGELLDTVRAKQAESWGAVVLPIDVALSKRSGVGGYYRRAFGEGLPMAGNAMIPRAVGQMTLFLAQGSHKLTWKARVVPEAATLPGWIAGSTYEGSIRIIPDGSQESPFRFGLGNQNAHDMRAVLTTARTPQGLVISGDADVTVPQDGLYGVALYGRVAGFRLRWLAASQVSR